MLGADFSVEAFFGRSDPATVYLKGYLDRWGEDDMLLVVADGGDEGLLSRRRLRGMDELADQLAEVDGVGGVMGLPRVPRVQRGPAGQWMPTPLLATAPPADAPPDRLERWTSSVLADSSLVPTFLSEEGRFGVIMMALDVDTQDLSQVKPVVQGIQEALEQARRDGDRLEGVGFHIGGVPAIRSDVLGVIVRDQVMNVPIAAVLMGGLLALLFRSRHGVLIPGVAAGVPVFMLLGLMGWTGEPFGLLNQVFLALVPAIAVADAVHLVSRYHEEADALGGASRDMDVQIRNEAIIRAMSYMGLACFLTSFTTIIGFLSLLLTDMPVLRTFGIYAALGVGLAYFTVLFIVPLALLSTRSGARRLDHDDEGVIGWALRLCWEIATRRAGWVLSGALGVLLGCVYLAWDVEADWKVTATFHDDHPVSVANRIIDDELGGVLALEVDMVGPPGVFRDREVLETLHGLEKETRERFIVRASASLASMVATTARLVSGGQEAIPEEEGALRRVLDLGDRAGQLSRFVDEEGARSRVVLRMRDLGATHFLALNDSVREAFRERLEPLGIEVHTTGSSLVASRGVGRVTTDLRDSLLAAFGVIAVIIAVLFRKVRYGVISVLPNVLPLAAALGVMAVAGWTLEPGAAVVFTIAIGISVDSAIHVFARFDESRSQGHGVDEALRDAIFHSGRAILITTLILIVGFAVNINSSAPANAAFGRIGTTIVGVALVSNLLVLPALIKLVAQTGKLAGAETESEPGTP